MLNFHHLRYFWEVARDGNLTRTARKLRVSQSALSSQIRLLEADVGQSLFLREGRRLILTEAGKIAQAYADEIFEGGAELLATLRQGRLREHTLSIGAVATLSRNFQRSFLGPLLGPRDLHLRIVSGSLEELLGQLEVHQLDILLSNRPPPRTSESRFRVRRLARQPVSLISSRPVEPFRFPHDLQGKSLILPGHASGFRPEFDALLERVGVSVKVLAEVDDMAMLRLLALRTDALTLVPSIVVRDELRQALLFEWCVVPDLSETFYAITIGRRFQHPLLHALLDRNEAQLLEEPLTVQSKKR